MLLFLPHAIGPFLEPSNIPRVSKEMTHHLDGRWFFLAKTVFEIITETLVHDMHFIILQKVLNSAR